MAVNRDLIKKTKFVPFINKAASSPADWVRISKSTTYSLAFNPQTKTFDFISSEAPEEEVDSYQPALSQSLTMFKNEPDFDLIWDMCFNLPTGQDAHKDVLMGFYANYYDLYTYAASEDESVVAGKDYYTRTGSEGSYVYTKVTNPTGNPSESNYYEVDTTTRYYEAWLVDSVVKLGTLDSVAQSITFDLALNNHVTGALYIDSNKPKWQAGTWANGVFTPSVS